MWDLPSSYLFSQIPSSGWLGLNINFLIPEAEEQEAHISLILPIPRQFHNGCGDDESSGWAEKRVALLSGRMAWFLVESRMYKDPKGRPERS